MPTNPFELLEKNVFAVTLAQFGFDASWTPSDGSPMQSGRVHYRNPTHLLSQKGGKFLVDYDPEKWYMEYHKDVFTGLKQASDDHSNTEVVTVNGDDFYVRKVTTKSDGDTYIALLQPMRNI